MLGTSVLADNHSEAFLLVSVTQCVTKLPEDGRSRCLLSSCYKGTFVASDDVSRALMKCNGYHLIDFGCEHGLTAAFFNRENNSTIQISISASSLNRLTSWHMKLSQF